MSLNIELQASFPCPHQILVRVKDLPLKHLTFIQSLMHQLIKPPQISGLLLYQHWKTFVQILMLFVMATVGLWGQNIKQNDIPI